MKGEEEHWNLLWGRFFFFHKEKECLIDVWRRSTQSLLVYQDYECPGSTFQTLYERKERFESVTFQEALERRTDVVIDSV